MKVEGDPFVPLPYAMSSKQWEYRGLVCATLLQGMSPHCPLASLLPSKF